MDESIKLYFFDLKKLDLEKNIPFLLEEDIQKSKRYKMEINQKQHLVSAYLKRRFVGDFSIDEKGKPYSTNCFFSVSHSNEMVVLAISFHHPVGVDVEEIKETKENLRAFVSSKKEYEYIKDNKNFFEIWTSKESLAKASGLGLSDIKNIPALPLDGLKEYKKKTYRSKIIYLDNYVISITREKESDMTIDKIEVTI